VRCSLSRLAARCLLAGTLLAAIAGAESAGQRAGATRVSAPVTLTFYDGGLYTTNGSAATLAIVKGYEALHPAVRIKIIPYSGNYVTDISTALAGGTAADVVVPTAEQQIWTTISKGYWQDLTPYSTKPDPYLPGRESLSQALLPGTLDPQRAYDGKLYVLSATAVDQAFYYNKSIFAKAGITSVPGTWDALISDLKRIRAAGYTPIEMQLGDTLYGDTMGTLLSVLESQVMGATIAKLDLNHNGLVDVRELALGMKAGIFSAGNPEFQEALKLVTQLYPYVERGAAGVSLESGERGFIRGRAALYYDGLWDAAVIDGGHPSFQYGFFPMPHVTSASSRFAYPGRHGTGVYGPTGAVSLAVPSTTIRRGHLDLAIDFIQYLTSIRNTDILDRTIAGLSILKGGHNDPKFAVFTDISAHPSPLASAELTFPPEFVILPQQLLVGYLTGQKSWPDLLKALQANMDAHATQVLSSYHLHA